MSDLVLNTPGSKYRPVAIETTVDPAVLLAGVKFHRACQPAILDHSLEGRAMKTEKMHLDEFKKRAAQAAATYVLEIYRHDTDPEGVYLFRYSMSDKPLSVTLVDEVTVDRVHLDSNSFRPARPVRFMFLAECGCDLEKCWGRDELARQLGEQLLRAIASATTEPLPHFVGQEPTRQPTE